MPAKTRSTKSKSAPTTEPTPRKLTKKQRQAELEAFIDLCFARLGDRGVREIAELTKLSKTTIHNLRNGKVSLASRYNTVTALGYVAGMELRWTKTSARIVLL